MALDIGDGMGPLLLVGVVIPILAVAAERLVRRSR